MKEVLGDPRLIRTASNVSVALKDCTEAVPSSNLICDIIYTPLHTPPCSCIAIMSYQVGLRMTSFANVIGPCDLAG